MRNLKRALSVALAAVMLLGMMVIGAGAMSIDDFADKDEIDNKEAVALMVDLGVLEGLDGPNGTTIFQPDATLQRQAMAKIAYMVATGETDWTLYEKTGNPSFKDIGNSWAKGAIEYCNNLGYITGNGDGTFSPEGKLTVAATATILLRVLGFDNERQGYNGDQWMINAMKDAKNNGLLAGVSNVSGAAFISRQDACQMAYNALFTNVRETNEDRDMGEWYVKGYDVKPYTLGLQSYGLVKLTATANSATTVGNTVTVTPGGISGTTTVTTGTVLAGYINAAITKGDYAITPEMVGGNVTVYAHADYTEAAGALATITVDKLVSSAMVEAPTTVLATVTSGLASSYTNATTPGARGFKAELEATPTGNGGPTVTYFVNGESVSGSAPYGNGASDDKATGVGSGEVNSGTSVDAVASMVPGSIVEFIDTDNNGKADVVKVTKKSVAVLNNAPTVNKTATTSLVTIAELGIANADVKNVVGYEGLVKGDVVKMVKIGNIYYIEKAEKVTGSVAGNHSIYGALINGAYYGATGLKTVTNATAPYTANSVNDNATYDFYLDDGKNIIAAIKVTDGTVATANYAVLADYSWVKPTSTGDMTQNVGSSYMQAKLVFTDGTSQIVRIATVDGVAPKGVNLTAQLSTITGAAGAATHYVVATDAATLATNTAAGQTTTAVSSTTFTGASSNGKFIALYNDTDTTIDAVNTKLVSKFIVVDDSNTTNGKGSLTACSAIVQNAFYTYTTNNDGSYNLVSAAKGTDTLGTLANHVITTGAVKFDDTTIGNNNTVFICATQNPLTQAWTYTTYTGINNVPTTAAAPSNHTTPNSVVKNAAGVATYVFAVIGSTVNASQDIVYIPDTTDFTTTTDGTSSVIYSNAIVNGEAKIITVTADKSGDGSGFYPVTNISDKGVYTLGSKVSAAADGTTSGIGTGVKSTAGNVLITYASGDKAYTYATGCEAYYINAQGASSKTTVEGLAIDATDQVYVIASNGVASVVYVVEKSAAPVSLAVTGGSPSQGNLLVANPAVGGITAGSTTLTITAGATTGMTYSYTIDGAGTDTTDAAYTVVQGDLDAGSVKVLLTATDNYSGAVIVLEYTIAVSA